MPKGRDGMAQSQDATETSNLACAKLACPDILYSSNIRAIGGMTLFEKVVLRTSVYELAWPNQWLAGLKIKVGLRSGSPLVARQGPP